MCYTVFPPKKEMAAFFRLTIHSDPEQNSTITSGTQASRFWATRHGPQPAAIDRHARNESHKEKNQKKDKEYQSKI